MHNVIAGSITGAVSMCGGLIASALGENTPVTIGLALGAACLVYYVTKEFTKLCDTVEQLKKEVQEIKKTIKP